MHNHKQLVWLESTGGPLVLLEEALVPYWNGYLSQSDGGMTDYERACAVSDYLGTIDVGAGRAVVLGDQPYSTAWWHSSESGHGSLVRWVCAENEAAIIEALTTLSSTNSWERNDVELEVAKWTARAF